MQLHARNNEFKLICRISTEKEQIHKVLFKFHAGQSHSQAMWCGNETSPYSEDLGEQGVDAAIVQ